MATAFLGDDFLLTSDTARTLYHGAAAEAPIVDPHTHLSATDIADDRVYETLTDLWLEDDHYKWRAMRRPESTSALVTGDADPWDRFAAWAATLPGLVRNPLYVWTHLELRRVFGIDLPLSRRAPGRSGTRPTASSPGGRPDRCSPTSTWPSWPPPTTRATTSSPTGD